MVVRRAERFYFGATHKVRVPLKNNYLKLQGYNGLFLEACN